MFQYGKMIYPFIKAVFLTVFIMSLSFCPLDYTVEEESADSAALPPVSHINMDMPPAQLVYHNSPLLISQKEFSTLIDLIISRGRHLKDYRKFINSSPALYTQFPAWITVFAIISSYRRSNNNLSVLSLKIGGHAPPLPL